MSRWRLAALIVTIAGSVARAAPDRPAGAAPAVSYTLQATLDPGARRVDGRGRVRWRNTAAAPIGELRLSLYYIARAGAADAPAIDVTFLRLVPSGRDLLASAATVSAGDDRLRGRGRELRVPLAEPLPPGGELSMDMQWVAHVPADAAAGGVVLVAQWFPQLITVDDDGAYDVTIVVPDGWAVAATGHEEAAADAGQSGRHRFVQAHARGFAWTASRDWIERRTRVERETLPPIDVRVLARPEHAAQLPRMIAAVSEAMRQGPRVLAPYEYADLTVVDLPWRSVYANTAYPGLVTIAARWLEPARSTDLESDLAAVLASHYWQQSVGVDAADQPSLAGGLAVYSAERLGAALVQRQLDSTSGDGFLVERFFGGFAPYVNRTIRFNHAPDHGSADARRTARALATLERHLGWPTVEMVLDEFATRFRLERPGLDEFAAVAASVSGRDLNWFFDSAFRERLEFDYAVDQVAAQTPTGGAAYRTAVVVKRLGGGIFSGSSRPRVGDYQSGRAVEVEVVFGDGSVRREHWDGRDLRTTFVFDSAAPVDRVAVDPDWVVRLDTARTNNTWARASRAPAAAARWTAPWLLWLQGLLLTYAALA